MGLFGGKKEKNQSVDCSEMGEWLAHPNEYGTPPKRTWHIGRYPMNIMPNPDPVNIDLIGYEMPDGTTGRGFLGHITWAFMGNEIKHITDESIVLAYTGWAFLFAALQQGDAITDFPESSEEQAFREQMSKVKDFEITGKTKIGDMELYSYTGYGLGQKIQGCGGTDTSLYYTADMPEYNLPTIYYLLGNEQNG